jgi:hypothetical protein
VGGSLIRVYTMFMTSTSSWIASNIHIKMGCDMVAMLITYSVQTYQMLCVPLSCF